MSFFPKIAIKTLGWAAARRFDKATRDPVNAQHRKLMEIVQRNQDTEYGKKYGFRDIKSLDDWQQKIPAVNYENIKEWVERTARGERNLLTAEDPIMFAQTSGTTGDPKYIPVTPTSRGRDQAHQFRAWLYHAYQDHPTIFDGKLLSLVSPAVEGHTEGDLPYGSTSGDIYKNAPRMVRSAHAIPYEVFEIKDFKTKYSVLMRIGIGADVTLLLTANPSSILKMCEIANEYADDILRDVADGTLKKEGLKLGKRVREKIEALCPPNPGKARKLRDAIEKRGGKLLPVDYWPNLALIACWKGGTVGTYLERFPKWFCPEGDKAIPMRDLGYLSSEARGSIALSDEGSGGVLTVASNVYEFVEVDDLEQSPDDWKSWSFLGIDNLQEGKEYYVFLTTTGGLYRYDINDVLKVVGHYNKTPVVEFLRKGREVTSITGEKVTVIQVIEVLRSASREIGIAIEHFKVEADIDSARYIFKVEASAGIPVNARRPLLESLDRNLARLNIEYEAKRKSLRLHPPVLTVMRPGWNEKEEQQAILRGKRDFQRKSIILSYKNSETDDFVEAIVNLDEFSHAWETSDGHVLENTDKELW